MIFQNDQITVLTQVHMIVVNLLLLFQDVTYSKSAPLIKPESSLIFKLSIFSRFLNLIWFVKPLTLSPENQDANLLTAPI